MVETNQEGKRRHLLLFTIIEDNRLFHIDIEGNALKRIGTAVGFINPDYCVVLDDRNSPDKSIYGDGWRFLPPLLSNCLYLPNVLDYLFGIQHIDDILGTILWKDHRTNKTCYKLTTDSKDFETNATCLLYDLVSALMTADNLSFNFFIGEYDNRIDTDGVRRMGNAFFEGGKQFCDQKVTRGSDSTYHTLLPYKYPGSSAMSFGLVEGAITYTGFMNKGHSYYGTRVFGKGNITAKWTDDKPSYIIECNNNTVYCGYAMRGTKTGWGIAMMGNGSISYGWWDKNGINGECITYSLVGTTYRGYLYDREFTRFGEMYYRNYSFYEGGWKLSQYDRYGLFVLSNEENERKRKYYLRYWRYGEKSDVLYPIENENDKKIQLSEEIAKKGELYTNVKSLVIKHLDEKRLQLTNNVEVKLNR